MIYENECFSNSIHDPVDPLGLSNIPNAPNHQVKSFLIYVKDLGIQCGIELWKWNNFLHLLI